MNQFLSFQRFSLLVAKHWADNKRRYALSVLAFIGLLITWFVFTMLTLLDEMPMGKEVQTVTYFFALFAFGTFYASQYFSDLGSRPKGINFLLVPASTFEKILCSLLFTVVFFFAVFTATFYLVDVIMVGISKAFPHPHGKQAVVANVFDIISLPFNKDTFINFLLFYFSVQSAFLLGSVYFEKYSFIKTIICGFVAGFIVFCFMFFFNEHLFHGGSYHRGFMTSYRIHVDGVHDRVVEIPGWIGHLFRMVVMYGMAPFLWLVTYFRLKEKQV